jgi:hypothetical protein
MSPRTNAESSAGLETRADERTDVVMVISGASIDFAGATISKLPDGDSNGKTDGVDAMA